MIMNDDNNRFSLSGVSRAQLLIEETTNETESEQIKSK